MIYERMLSEYKHLDSQISSIKGQLQALPPNKLICTQNGNRYKWYQSDGHTKTYIPKENRRLAEQLAKKKYLSLKLEDLENEKRAIGFYLAHRSPSDKSKKLLTENSEYQQLLTPYFSPLSDELNNWKNAPYERNPLYPEQRTQKTASGIYVRSKSEAIIDMYLYTNQIPFRYECLLKLGEFTAFPDFTIRHPKTGEIYYWEHFGMMDNPAYAQKAFSKMQEYTNHGIFPSVQLITTYESKEQPLSIEMVEKIVAHYFL